VALNIERFEKDLNDLIHRGMMLECAMVRDTQGIQGLRDALGEISDDAFAKLEAKIPQFRSAYEAWYSECLPVLKQLLPDRLDDFKRQYERARNRKDTNFESYVIEDFMLGLRVTYGGDVKADSRAAIPKMQNQCAILAAAKARFNSSLFEIRQLVQADLFDSEIASARELQKNKFYRAAGAVAGVVLEKHLAQVCSDHNIKIAKKNPGISDLNEALKAAATIDVPQWRHISLLGDIRNICDHNKQKEPTESQVADLIDGTDKVLKTIA
jgi:hypothetical protein